MKTIIVRRMCACSIVVATTLCAIGTILGQPYTRLKLNKDAFAFGLQLVKQGRFITDGKGAWSEHRPSTDDENEFIRVHGFSEYAKWHLAIDQRYPENTKRRYKFPYGDFKNVHRCGVLTAKARAHQYGHTDVETAAADLIGVIETGAAKAAECCCTPKRGANQKVYSSVASWSALAAAGAF